MYIPQWKADIIQTAFAHSFVRSFAHSIVHSFIHSCIHSFVVMRLPARPLPSLTCSGNEETDQKRTHWRARVGTSARAHTGGHTGLGYLSNATLETKSATHPVSRIQPAGRARRTRTHTARAHTHTHAGAVTCIARRRRRGPEKRDALYDVNEREKLL